MSTRLHLSSHHFHRVFLRSSPPTSPDTVDRGNIDLGPLWLPASALLTAMGLKEFNADLRVSRASEVATAARAQVGIFEL